MKILNDEEILEAESQGISNLPIKSKRDMARAIAQEQLDSCESEAKTERKRIVEEIEKMPSGIFCGEPITYMTHWQSLKEKILGGKI